MRAWVPFYVRQDPIRAAQVALRAAQGARDSAAPEAKAVDATPLSNTRRFSRLDSPFGPEARAALETATRVDATLGVGSVAPRAPAAAAAPQADFMRDPIGSVSQLVRAAMDAAASMPRTARELQAGECVQQLGQITRMVDPSAPDADGECASLAQAAFSGNVDAAAQWCGGRCKHAVDNIAEFVPPSGGDETCEEARNIIHQANDLCSPFVDVDCAPQLRTIRANMESGVEGASASQIACADLYEAGRGPDGDAASRAEWCEGDCYTVVDFAAAEVSADSRHESCAAARTRIEAVATYCSPRVDGESDDVDGYGSSAGGTGGSTGSGSGAGGTGGGTGYGSSDQASCAADFASLKRLTDPETPRAGRCAQAMAAFEAGDSEEGVFWCSDPGECSVEFNTVVSTLSVEGEECAAAHDLADSVNIKCDAIPNGETGSNSGSSSGSTDECPESCVSLLGNGVCDKECNTVACGMDCSDELCDCEFAPGPDGEDGEDAGSAASSSYSDDGGINSRWCAQTFHQLVRLVNPDAEFADEECASLAATALQRTREPGVAQQALEQWCSSASCGQAFFEIDMDGPSDDGCDAYRLYDEWRDMCDAPDGSSNSDCPTACTDGMIGNHICDEACYIEECGWDDGDCDSSYASSSGSEGSGSAGGAPCTDWLARMSRFVDPRIADDTTRQCANWAIAAQLNSDARAQQSFCEDGRISCASRFLVAARDLPPPSSDDGCTDAHMLLAAVMDMCDIEEEPSSSYGDEAGADCTSRLRGLRALVSADGEHQECVSLWRSGADNPEGREEWCRGQCGEEFAAIAEGTPDGDLADSCAQAHHLISSVNRGCSTSDGPGNDEGESCDAQFEAMNALVTSSTDNGGTDGAPSCGDIGFFFAMSESFQAGKQWCIDLGCYEEFTTAAASLPAESAGSNCLNARRLRNEMHQACQAVQDELDATGYGSAGDPTEQSFDGESGVDADDEAPWLQDGRQEGSCTEALQSMWEATYPSHATEDTHECAHTAATFFPMHVSEPNGADIEAWCSKCYEEPFLRLQDSIYAEGEDCPRAHGVWLRAKRFCDTGGSDEANDALGCFPDLGKMKKLTDLTQRGSDAETACAKLFVSGADGRGEWCSGDCGVKFQTALDSVHGKPEGAAACGIAKQYALQVDHQCSGDAASASDSLGSDGTDIGQCTDLLSIMRRVVHAAVAGAVDVSEFDSSCATAWTHFTENDYAGGRRWCNADSYCHAVFWGAARAAPTEGEDCGRLAEMKQFVRSRCASIPPAHDGEDGNGESNDPPNGGGGQQGDSCVEQLSGAWKLMDVERADIDDRSCAEQWRAFANGNRDAGRDWCQSGCRQDFQFFFEIAPLEGEGPGCARLDELAATVRGECEALTTDRTCPADHDIDLDDAPGCCAELLQGRQLVDRETEGYYPSCVSDFHAAMTEGDDEARARFCGGSCFKFGASLYESVMSRRVTDPGCAAFYDLVAAPMKLCDGYTDGEGTDDSEGSEGGVGGGSTDDDKLEVCVAEDGTPATNGCCPALRHFRPVVTATHSDSTCLRLWQEAQDSRSALRLFCSSPQCGEEVSAAYYRGLDIIDDAARLTDVTSLAEALEGCSALTTQAAPIVARCLAIADEDASSAPGSESANSDGEDGERDGMTCFDDPAAGCCPAVIYSWQTAMSDDGVCSILNHLDDLDETTLPTLCGACVPHLERAVEASPEYGLGCRYLSSALQQARDMCARPSGDVYCFAEIQEAHAIVESSFGSPSQVGLKRICNSPCRAQIEQSFARSGDAASEAEVQSRQLFSRLLCTQEPDEGDYCLPKMDELFPGDVEPEVSEDQEHQCPPDMSRVCTPCGRILSSVVGQSSGQKGGSQLLQAFMDFGCSTNSKGRRCGDVMNDMTGQGSCNADPDATATQLWNTANSQCSNLRSLNVAETCPAECARAIHDANEHLGCCLSGALRYQDLVAEMMMEFAQQERAPRLLQESKCQQSQEGCCLGLNTAIFNGLQDDECGSYWSSFIMAQDTSVLPAMCSDHCFDEALSLTAGAEQSTEYGCDEVSELRSMIHGVCSSGSTGGSDGSIGSADDESPETQFGHVRLMDFVELLEESCEDSDAEDVPSLSVRRTCRRGTFRPSNGVMILNINPRALRWDDFALYQALRGAVPRVLASQVGVGAGVFTVTEIETADRGVVVHLQIQADSDEITAWVDDVISEGDFDWSVLDASVPPELRLDSHSSVGEYVGRNEDEDENDYTYYVDDDTSSGAYSGSDEVHEGECQGPGAQFAFCCQQSTMLNERLEVCTDLVAPVVASINANEEVNPDALEKLCSSSCYRDMKEIGDRARGTGDAEGCAALRASARLITFVCDRAEEANEDDGDGEGEYCLPYLPAVTALLENAFDDGEGATLVPVLSRVCKTRCFQRVSSYVIDSAVANGLAPAQVARIESLMRDVCVTDGTDSDGFCWPRIHEIIEAVQEAVEVEHTTHQALCTPCGRLASRRVIAQLEAQQQAHLAEQWRTLADLGCTRRGGSNTPYCGTLMLQALYMEGSEAHATFSSTMNSCGAVWSPTWGLPSNQRSLSNADSLVCPVVREGSTIVGRCSDGLSAAKAAFGCCYRGMLGGFIRMMAADNTIGARRLQVQGPWPSGDEVEEAQENEQSARAISGIFDRIEDACAVSFPTNCNSGLLRLPHSSMITNLRPAFLQAISDDLSNAEMLQRRGHLTEAFVYTVARSLGVSASVFTVSSLQARSTGVVVNFVVQAENDAATRDLVATYKEFEAAGLLDSTAIDELIVEYGSARYKFTASERVSISPVPTPGNGDGGRDEDEDGDSGDGGGDDNDVEEPEDRTDFNDFCPSGVIEGCCGVLADVAALREECAHDLGPILRGFGTDQEGNSEPPTVAEVVESCSTECAARYIEMAERASLLEGRGCRAAAAFAAQIDFACGKQPECLPELRPLTAFISTVGEAFESDSGAALSSDELKEKCESPCMAPVRRLMSRLSVDADENGVGAAGDELSFACTRLGDDYCFAQYSDFLRDSGFRGDGGLNYDQVCTGCGRLLAAYTLDRFAEKENKGNGGDGESAGGVAPLYRAIVDYGCGINHNGNRCGSYLDVDVDIDEHRRDTVFTPAYFDDVLESCGDVAADDFGRIHTLSDLVDAGSAGDDSAEGFAPTDGPAHACPNQCAETWHRANEELGCCFWGAGVIAWRSRTPGASDARAQWLLEKVARNMDSVCDAGIEHGRVCRAGETVGTSSLFIPNVRLSYLRNHPGVMQAVKEAVLRTLGTRFGVAVDVFVVQDVALGDGGIVIHVSFQAENDATTLWLGRQIAAAVEEGAIDWRRIYNLLPTTQDALYTPGAVEASEDSDAVAEEEAAGNDASEGHWWDICEVSDTNGCCALQGELYEVLASDECAEQLEPVTAAVSGDVNGELLAEACTSECFKRVAEIAGRIRTTEGKGCADATFLSSQVQFACAREVDADSGDTTWCAESRKNYLELAEAASQGDADALTDDALDGVCTDSCLRRVTTNAAALRRYAEGSAARSNGADMSSWEPSDADAAVQQLCVRAQGEYCMAHLPAYMALVGDSDGEGRIDVDWDATCTPCGRIIVPLVLGRQTADLDPEQRAAVQQAFDGAFTFGCARNDRNERCGELVQRESVTHAATMCQWDGMLIPKDAGDMCSGLDGCVQSLQEAKNDLGCCMSALLEQHVRMGNLVDPDGEHYITSMDDATVAMQDGCGVPVSPCVGRLQYTVEVPVRNVRLVYLNRNPDSDSAFRAKLAEVLGERFGVRAETFTAFALQNDAGVGVIAVVRVRADSDDATDAVHDMLREALDNGALDLSAAVEALPRNLEARYFLTDDAAGADEEQETPVDDDDSASETADGDDDGETSDGEDDDNEPDDGDSGRPDRGDSFQFGEVDGVCHPDNEEGCCGLHRYWIDTRDGLLCENFVDVVGDDPNAHTASYGEPQPAFLRWAHRALADPRPTETVAEEVNGRLAEFCPSECQENLANVAGYSVTRGGIGCETQARLERSFNTACAVDESDAALPYCAARFVQFVRHVRANREDIGDAELASVCDSPCLPAMMRMADATGLGAHTLQFLCTKDDDAYCLPMVSQWTVSAYAEVEAGSDGAVVFDGEADGEFDGSFDGEVISPDTWDTASPNSADNLDNICSICGRTFAEYRASELEARGFTQRADNLRLRYVYGCGEERTCATYIERSYVSEATTPAVLLDVVDACGSDGTLASVAQWADPATQECPAGCAAAITAAGAAAQESGIGCCAFGALAGLLARESGGFDADTAGAVVGNLEAACGLQVPRICARVIRTLRRSMHIQNVRLDYLELYPSAMASFRADFVRAMAARFGVDASLIRITGLRAGSVEVDYEIDVADEQQLVELEQQIYVAEVDGSLPVEAITESIPPSLDARETPNLDLSVTPGAPPAAPQFDDDYAQNGGDDTPSSTGGADDAAADDGTDDGADDGADDVAADDAPVGDDETGDGGVINPSEDDDDSQPTDDAPQSTDDDAPSGSDSQTTDDGSTSTDHDAQVTNDTPDGADSSGGSPGVIVAVAFVGVMAIAVGAWYFLFREKAPKRVKLTEMRDTGDVAMRSNPLHDRIGTGVSV